MKTNRQIKNIFAAIVVAFSFASCTKVIDIDLNSSESKFVIEGAVYEGVDSVIVSVTKTGDFFENGTPQPVANANVVLTMPDNSLITLAHLGQGKYQANGLNIVNQANYALRVEVDNQVFTANSYMKASLPLDSATYEFTEGLFGSDDGYTVFYNYQDQPGKDFYRFIYGQNGKILNEPQDIQVVDDNLNDGNYIRIPVFSRTFEPGDTIYCELQSLDTDLYEFYQTFAAAASESAGSPFSAAPANPETNIKGGALGVFGAYTRSFGTVILPE
jgi:hypothetical protein